MNKNYRKGYVFENRLVNDLKKQGCQFVVRTAGSHSQYDIVAIKDETLFLIQCKANELRPSELKKLKESFTQFETLTPVQLVAYKKGSKRVLEGLE